jgi:DNA-binding transcriptional LysR family regulator
MSDAQLPHLETFARAAEAGSFTAAARTLGLTQAAVSQRIQTLEQALGVPLFFRRGGRVLLTEGGHRLHPYAQRILALHAEARREVAGHKDPVAGDLILAASSVPVEHLLSAALAAFRRSHPHIQVRVAVTDSQAVLDQVERAKAALGLVGGKGHGPHLQYRPFASDRLALIVPAGHALARRRLVPLRDFCRLALILREAGSGSRWCLEQALARAGKSLSDLHVVLEVGSNEAIKEAVLGGMGLAVLSTRVVERELQAEQLHALPVAGLPLQREMFVVWDRRRALPIPARLFLDLLETAPGDSPCS